MPTLLPWLLAACVLLLGLWLAWRGGRLRLLGMLLAGFGFTSLHAAHALDLQLPLALEKKVLTVSGRIDDLPVHESRRTRFEFIVDDDEAIPDALRDKRVRVGWFDEDIQAREILQAGSRWRLPLRLRAPQGLRNPGGSDGEKQAMAARITATGYVLEPALAQPLSPPTGMSAWREQGSARIAHAVPSPSSRFVRALALGDTRALDDDDWTRLRAAGLTHLIAISGFHVGLVAGFFSLMAAAVWWLLPALGTWLPRPFAAGFGAVAGAFAYAAITGFALPTLRTAVMIAALVLARCLRR
ncbi:MAG: ComEC/Rec2 family competence protein, partial [Thermomonas sp.]